MPSSPPPATTSDSSSPGSPFFAPGSRRSAEITCPSACLIGVLHGRLDQLLKLGRTRQMKVGAFERPQSSQVPRPERSEEHTSDLQSLMRIAYAVFCVKHKNPQQKRHIYMTTD